MDTLGRKIVTDDAGRVGFHCPGCGIRHIVPTAKSAAQRWYFNNDGNKPTITPAIVWATDHTYCHSMVSDGEIIFNSACHHDLAGDTVELPDITALETAA